MTVLDGERSTQVVSDGMLLEVDDLLAATGWELKPQGLCRGEVCVPTSLSAPVSLIDVATALHRPVALEQLTDAWVAVLGEPGGTALHVGDVAPSVVLPDVDGRDVQVTGTGRKTAVVVWSTWCGCRYELPAWKQLAAELHADGLDIITVALDEDVEAVRPWAGTTDLPTAVDTEHLLSDVFGVVNVPSTVWLDEQGRVVKPPTIAPGDDQFLAFTEVDAERHHEALRAWVRGGVVPDVPEAVDDEAVRAARAERRLGAWLHRHGHTEAAERHFAAAVALAPLDFTIRRASMPLRGQDPFGTEFFVLWEQWNDAGRPGYLAT